jgi:hypothetical protein
MLPWAAMTFALARRATVALVCASLWVAAVGRAETPATAPAIARADMTAPPPRPPPGDAEARARVLFEAIVHDDPARAADFFFPRDAFLQVKAMARPERYYDRLRKRYDQDIHALHRSLAGLERAEFDRLELVARGGYVRPGEEGNRLPYWASRHAWLHYRVDGKPRKLEIRVLITWQERWYVIHLSEFR